MGSLSDFSELELEHCLQLANLGWQTKFGVSQVNRELHDLIGKQPDFDSIDTIAIDRTSIDICSSVARLNATRTTSVSEDCQFLMWLLRHVTSLQTLNLHFGPGGSGTGVHAFVFSCIAKTQPRRPDIPHMISVQVDISDKQLMMDVNTFVNSQWVKSAMIDLEFLGGKRGDDNANLIQRIIQSVVAKGGNLNTLALHNLTIDRALMDKLTSTLANRSINKVSLATMEQEECVRALGKLISKLRQQSTRFEQLHLLLKTANFDPTILFSELNDKATQNLTELLIECPSMRVPPQHWTKLLELAPNITKVSYVSSGKPTPSWRPINEQLLRTICLAWRDHLKQFGPNTKARVGNFFVELNQPIEDFIENSLSEDRVQLVTNESNQELIFDLHEQSELKVIIDYTKMNH